MKSLSISLRWCSCRAAFRCCGSRVCRRNGYVDGASRRTKRPHRSKSVHKRRHFDGSGDVFEIFVWIDQCEVDHSVDGRDDDVRDYILLIIADDQMACFDS